MISVNNKLMLEPYTGSKKIESTVKSGFATIKQKSTLVGLKLVADGKIPLGREAFLEVKKGQTVYYSEEILHASDWSTKTYNLQGSTDQFILGEALHVVGVD
jgi:hypothetical protein